MSMQIQVDPAGLTQAQREAVAGFILAYPAEGVASSSGNVAVAEIHDNKETVRLRVPTQVAAMVAANPAGAVDAIADLAREDGEFDASVAFSTNNEAAEAFGNERPPLPPGAIAAPFTAGAVPSAIALENMTAATSPMTFSAPVPPAPTPVNVALPVALPTSNPVGTVELDKNGLPWDARIHAESKAKISDGTWRKKRNLDPATLAMVETQLRQTMGAAPVPNVAPPPPMPANLGLPLSSVAPSASAGPNVAYAPSVAAIPAPPSSPNVPPADPRQAFVSLVGRASAAIQGGKLTQAEITAFCTPLGIAALPLLTNRLDLVPQVATQVDALIASRS